MIALAIFKTQGLAAQSNHILGALVSLVIAVPLILRYQMHRRQALSTR